MPFDRDAAFPRTHPWASSAPPRDRGGDFLGARAGAPSEVLYRLREWCVCISAMGTDAYALLEWDGTQRRPELRLLLSSPGRLAERGRPLDRPTLAETIESSSPRPGPTLLTGASRPMSPTTASPTSWARGACRGRQCLPVLSDADVIDPDRPGAAPRRAMARGEGLRRARLGPMAMGAPMLAPQAHLVRAHWHHYWRAEGVDAASPCCAGSCRPWWALMRTTAPLSCAS